MRKCIILRGRRSRNYNPRGFQTSAKYGIIVGESVHLPASECLMLQELVPGGLEGMQGEVDYSFYESLK